jgi:Fe-S-cluster containining protein
MIQDVLNGWAAEGKKFGSVEDIYQYADEVIAKHKPFACGSGKECNGCCNQQVSISYLEFVHAFNDALTTGLFNKDNIDDIMDQASRRKYWTKGLRIRNDEPCLFLDRDGKCGVYKARPLVCRSYNIKRTCDADTCHDMRGMVDKKHLFTDDHLDALAVLIDKADDKRKTIDQHIANIREIVYE